MAQEGHPEYGLLASSERERGVKWLAEINKSLDGHSLGILCVTQGNKEKPWLLSEAGALSKHLGDEGRVIPYLLDFHSVKRSSRTVSAVQRGACR